MQQHRLTAAKNNLREERNVTGFYMSYCHMSGLYSNAKNKVVRATWEVNEMRVLPLKGR